jgi:DUF1365 family protein
MTASGFYTGVVSHARLRPRRHKLQYRLFNLLLDLDELPALGRRLRLFGFDRPALFSFHQRDHGAGTPTGLRAWVEQHLRDAGIEANGPISLLCMPRVLGHAFNPLSVYFCRRPDGELTAIVYQVNNTFGQRHSYLIPVTSSAAPGPVRQNCAKAFYVSPFMDMDLHYRFVIHPPAERVGVTVNVMDTEGLLLTASFRGDRRPLTDGALLMAFLRMPLLGLKVVAGIHWEALKIWRKGVAFRSRPPAPAQDVTIVNSQELSPG